MSDQLITTDAARGIERPLPTQGQPAPIPAYPRTTAIALSGGGAKGSFQIGALRYLYQHVLGQALIPLPTVLAGTSVGAVNATKLAEGGRQAFEELEKIWRGLYRNEDMYEEQSWFSTLEGVVKDVMRLVSSGGFGDWFEFAWDYLFNDEIADVPVDKIEAAMDQAAKAKSVYNLKPIARLMQQGALNPDKVRASGVKLRLAVVSLESGKLRYVTEQGTLLERDSTTQVYWKGNPTIEVIPPACRPITNLIDEIEADLEEVQQDIAAFKNDKEMLKILKARKLKLQRDLRQARGSLQSCIVRNGGMQQEPVESVVSLSAGVLASSAIPAVFEPARLLDETYVDGGVREIVPIQVCIDAGADSVFAICCAPSGLPQENTPGNMADLAKRALDTALDEVDLNETTASERWQGKVVTLIRPTFEVHDALTISQGLIRIAMAYGYMRAADEIAVASAKRPAARELSDAIAYRRQRNYEREAQAAGLHIAPKTSKTPTAIAKLLADSRLDKVVIRDLVKQRLLAGHAVAPHSERGWMDWECAPLYQHELRVWPATESTASAACQAQAQQVRGLELEIAEMQKELAKALPVEKAEIRAEIQQLKKELAKAEKALKACEAKHSAPPAPPANPAACAGLRSQLQQLQGELQAVQDDLSDPELPASERNKLSQRKMKLLNDIKAKQEDVRICTARHTFPQQRHRMTHGMLVKAQGQSDLYVVYGGAKLRLRGWGSQDPLVEMGYQPGEVVELPAAVLERIPTDLPVDGTLLSSRLGFVYVMDGGKRRLIPNDKPALYAKHKLDPREVRLVPEQTLAAIPAGATLN